MDELARPCSYRIDCRGCNVCNSRDEFNANNFISHDRNYTMGIEKSSEEKGLVVESIRFPCRYNAGTSDFVSIFHKIDLGTTPRNQILNRFILPTSESGL